MELKTYLAERKALIDQALEKYLPPVQGQGARVIVAMRYSLMAGGKRLRPILCLAAAEAVGGNVSEALPVACALEMIHTYSLIHDDLPAMDDDDLRRGQPTCHKKFDEATAILAGDGLLTEAFALMSQVDHGLPDCNAVVLEVINLIAQAAGSRGMVGGQMADLLAEGQSLGLPQIEAIHSLKTGALLTAAVRSGALLGGGSPKAVAHLTRYGQCFGLAFQITDDLLDVEGQAAEMGKSPGMDLLRQKATYPGILGVETARQQARQLVSQAVMELTGLGLEAEPLRELVQYLLIRRH